MPTGHPWSNEQIALILGMVERGLTYSVIAVEMGGTRRGIGGVVRRARLKSQLETAGLMSGGDD